MPHVERHSGRADRRASSPVEIDGSGLAQAPLAAAGPEDLGGRVAALESRIAELETRFEEMAASHDPAAGLESMLGRFLPPDVVRHMKTARREDMLALRSLLDAWIARIDRERSTPAGGEDAAKPRVERIVLE